MLDLAKHIVESKSGHFDPTQFEDHYEAALQDFWKRERAVFQSPSEPHRPASGKGEPAPKAGRATKTAPAKPKRKAG